MVYFITGPIGSGKSAKLVSLYESTRSGDGFYNIKRFTEGEMIGQDIVQLSTGKAVSFSRIDGAIPEGWDEESRYGKYSFSQEGLSFTRGILEEAIQKHALRVFVDELGPLEMQKKGLYHSFARLLQADIDIVSVCRDACVKDIIALFSIPEYKLFSPPRYSNPE